MVPSVERNGRRYEGFYFKTVELNEDFRFVGTGYNRKNK